ncbi:hypothetical protein [Nonomuraea sp. NPDC049309]|uniref:hypothetical protein n=1 Tax=Nonomuraea sp. NPDC049309 TaxID=3364350 RepID=UPI0037238009
MWDLKAKRAGLPPAKLPGAYRDSVPVYNTSGGYLQAPLEEVKERASPPPARTSRGWSTSNGSHRCSRERLRIEGGRMHVPGRPGLGLTLSGRARDWLIDDAEFHGR